MSPRYTLEIAVSTPDEAIIAASNGADRLELSSGLEVGGLTPSLHAFLAVQEAVSIPVYVLLRPRPGGFLYSDREFAVIERDAEEFLKRGASGIVFGILSSGGIDRSRCEKLVKLAGGRAVFHRAFDFLPDSFSAIDELIEMGFQRVLTSGQGITAAAGCAQLASLIRHTGKRLEILPAGNIRPENVIELMKKTGCNQVHSSARAAVADLLHDSNYRVASGMGLDASGLRLTTDPQLVAGLRSALDEVTGDMEEGDSAII
ncbi:MAG TPA: copper homeostasis protein CutC [Gemmata sp.]|nr:copper homeostasis protein CutC [Gemmata sp.]